VLTFCINSRHVYSFFRGGEWFANGGTGGLAGNYSTEGASTCLTCAAGNFCRKLPPFRSLVVTDLHASISAATM